MSWDGQVYGKYRITHADGTPLHGKEYFVLRLDSADPAEAKRVKAAMTAYKGDALGLRPRRNCDRFNTGDVKKDAQAAMEAILAEGVAGYRGIAEYLLSPATDEETLS